MGEQIEKSRSESFALNAEIRSNRLARGGVAREGWPNMGLLPLSRTNSFGACFLAVLAASMVVVSNACVPQTMGLTVRHANGVDPQPEGGTPMTITPLKRDDIGRHKPGYAVLRNVDDWDLFFGDPSIRANGIDWQQTMVIAGYADDSTLSALEIRKVTDNGDTVNVFATEVGAGDGCKQRQDHPAYSVVTVDKRNEPVLVYVEPERAERCEADPPKISVSCRIPPAKEWTNDGITAPLGQSVECVAAVDPNQRRTIVDRDWSIRELPRGSDSRVTLIDEARKASIVVDALGTYRLRVAATDEAARVGEAIAKIEAPPPSDDFYVELVWSNFTSSDDPDTFPRIELRAKEPAGRDVNIVPVATTPPSKATSVLNQRRPPAAAPAKPAAKECSLELADHPAWCDAWKYGKNTVMRLRGSTGGRFAIQVHYTDDRFAGAPVACIRTFAKGKMALELCDNQVRKAESNWDIGAIVEATGKFDVPEEVTTIAADGGAPLATDAGANVARDAGK
jgi:hypothetical protein